MIKTSVIFCLIILFISSCEKDSYMPKDIIGSWDWVSSNGGIGGSTYTPESTGDKIELVFTSDSIYKKYHNGDLKVECKFRIVESESSDNNELTKLIEYERRMIPQFYTLESSDILILTDNIFDGNVYTYKRIK